MKFTSFISILGTLLLSHRATSGRIQCPQLGQDPVEIVVPKRKIILALSSTTTLCTLVHVKHVDPTDTTDVTFTNNSPGSDFILTPIARSYYRNHWEKTPGPYDAFFKIKRCNNKRCVTRMKKNGKYFLITYEHSLDTFDKKLSRFFMQTTFGPTRDMLSTWSYKQSNYGMAQWVKDQIALPMTKHREFFRKNSDVVAHNNTIDQSGLSIQHPCAPYSRWRKYSFASYDNNNEFEVVVLGNQYAIIVDGAVRTVVDSFESSDGVYSGVGSYKFCWAVQEMIGGRVDFRPLNSGDCKQLTGGNPAAVLTSSAITTYGQLLRFIDLPNESQFEEVKPYMAQEWDNFLVMQYMRLKSSSGLFASQSTQCSSLGENYQYIVGRFPNGDLAHYHGGVSLMENSIESPLSDGGLSAVAIDDGAKICSNVGKDFLNIESCFLADSEACRSSASGLHQWDYGPVLTQNVVICGSEGEVSNDLTLDGTGPKFVPWGHYYNVIDGALRLQKKAVPYTIFLSANDQLRQRVAWALSQILVITPNQINSDDRESEIYLNYYDIFVRNAFGSYRDILKQVSYSPMMGEMLSYLESKSAQYVLQTEGRVSRPDENYAREIMQLFTIGLYKLKADGQLVRSQGEAIATYENSDIQTFARAWTGFRHQYLRFNKEGYRWSVNRIDPMRLEGRWRDPFPKMDLEEGFIGDGYPLCVDLPSKHFLKKGATYRLLGSALLAETEYERPWNNHTRVERFPLDGSNSDLHEILCNPDANGNCVFQPKVTLDTNIDCYGLECEVDNVNVVLVDGDVKYEYVRPACVELGFYKDDRLNKIVNRYREAMCLHKNIDDVAMHACCVAADRPNNWLSDYAENYCNFSFEKSSYATTQGRCQNMNVENYPNPDTCDWLGVRSYTSNQNDRQYCHFYIDPDLPSWHWTNQTCGVLAKVNTEGLVSIVHNPNLDLNIRLAANEETLQSIYQPVSHANTNYFKVQWEGNEYPSFSINQCANSQCVSMGNECLCDIEIIETRVFTSMPSKGDIIRFLKIGHSSPDSYPTGTFTLQTVTEDGVSLHYMTGKGVYSKTSVFGVEYRGQMRYFKNVQSTVNVLGSTYQFRNPPSFLNIAKPDTRDATYETDAVLDHYFYHPNTAPFLATRLIKRFGTSNPSYRFIKTVAKAFTEGTYTAGSLTFGDGNYGNLESMVAAIILDRESRSVIVDADPVSGSLREPLLKVTAFLRGMEYERSENVASLYMQGLQDFIGQEIHSIPNVFSFFLPDFSPPGKIAEAELTAPEAQVLDSPKIIGFLNGLFSLIDIGMSNCYSGFGDRNTWWCDGYRYRTPEEMGSRGFLTYYPTNFAHGNEVIDDMALLLTGGRLSSASKSILVNSYNDELQANGASAALKFVQKLFLAIPEFHSTNVFDSLDLPRPEAPLPQPSARSYKAIIYLNLDGGLDSFNVLVPHSNCQGDTAQYSMFDQYREVRGDIALEKDSLHTIDASSSSQSQVCNTFGLHPSLDFIKTLYDSNDLSFLANVGVLQQPVNKDDWWQKSRQTSLFSHNTQQDEINFVDIFDEEAGRGVGGRILDLLALNGYKPGAISTNGIASSIRSDSAPMVVVDPSGYKQFNPTSVLTSSVTDKVKEVTTAATIRSSLFAETWADALIQSLSENELLYEELSNAVLDVTFPDTDLGRQLSIVAKVMKTKNVRGTDRDIYNVRIGGFDLHTLIDVPLTERLNTIDNALEAFVTELKNHQQIWDDVVVVLVSEFGRTLMGNTGNGSDHAWGGNYFIAGGSVNGGQILGSFPSDMTNDGPFAFQPGIVIPSTPWEAMWNGLAQWFGINTDNDLDTVLPNRKTFKNSLWSMTDLFN